MAAPIVWINGFPGAGKLTVARALLQLEPICYLVDNHSLIDPVAAKFSRDHPFYQEERKLERQRAFEKFIYAEEFLPRIVIFTDFQSISTLGSSVAREYELAAREAGRPFVPVYLSCEHGVNLERATNEERINSKTTKLTDELLLNEMLSKCELYRFPEYPSFEVDTTSMEPEPAARHVLGCVLSSQNTASQLQETGMMLQLGVKLR